MKDTFATLNGVIQSDEKGLVFGVMFTDDEIVGIQKYLAVGLNGRRMEDLQKSIARGIKSGLYFQGTTAETIVIHEAVHSYFMDYYMKKSGLNYGGKSDDVSAAIFEQLHNTLTINLVEEALSNTSQLDYKSALIELGRYSKESEEELIAQSTAKYYTVGTSNTFIKYLVRLIEGLR